MTYYLVLSYDGTNFNGWQAQKKADLRTVQEVVEEVAKEIFHDKITITASGRTDAGVHALAQVCSFSANTTIPADRLADCFNAKLPHDVRVLRSGEAGTGFDACRNAKRKTYAYSLYWAERENPLKERTCVRIQGEVDFDLMQKAAKRMEGEHDFKAFCATNSSAKTTVRNVYSVKIAQEKVFSGDEIRIYVTGNGFLYNMVRTMVGTLLDVACKRKTLDDLEVALQAGEREKVGKTMPAKGLCLFDVKYDN